MTNSIILYIVLLGAIFILTMQGCVTTNQYYKTIYDENWQIIGYEER